MRTIVIGGGAAGLAAAICAAEAGERVTILERMDRVGKKLLATGNGRCNLMNTGAPRYPGGGSFAAEVLRRCGQREQERFWLDHGLRLRQEAEGRVYPVSGQASSVLDTLRYAAQDAGVTTVTGTEITGLRREGRAWRAEGKGASFTGDRVIVAAGGCAQPKLGSNGSGWQLLSRLGVPLCSPRPALTQIETERRWISGLEGIRVRCALTVLQGERETHREKGELLFAEYGVSGVCAMQCARYADAPDTWLTLSLEEGMGFSSGRELLSELERRRDRWGERPLSLLLTGLCVPRLSHAILRYAGMDNEERAIRTLSGGELDRIVEAIVRFRLRVKGIRGFDTAQVTAGGADCSAFSPETLSLIACPSLHVAGEVLDVDGDCGGYNLMFAFGSGILAGLNGRKSPYRTGVSEP